MFEINCDILEFLKCTQCDGYLSCGPVMLKLDGSSVCGRCSAAAPKHEVIRNVPYEQLAKMMSFPCGYFKQGCKSKVTFHQLKQHEVACKYRDYPCPILPSGICKWIGPRFQLLQHCQDRHPDHVLQHPCVLEHDVAQNTLRNYLTSAFNLLFLIHTKVCLSTRKIYHCVRYIGDPVEASNFNYHLDITNNRNKLTKELDVATQGCLTMQEESSIVVNINSLLEFLGKLQGTTFKITVNRVIKEVLCIKCRKHVLQPAFHALDGWFCIGCGPDKRPCENSQKGCSFVDIEKKAQKHQRYFCRYNTWCRICDKNIGCCLEDCYKINHSNVTYRAGEVMRIIVSSSWQYTIIASDIGTIVCWCFLFSPEFEIGVNSNLRSEALSLYSCELRLTNPVTGHTVHSTLEVRYDLLADWFGKIKENDLTEVLSDGQCDVTLEIIKKVPKS